MPCNMPPLALWFGAGDEFLMLHPTTKRFVLDEDCVSSSVPMALSDYDRVEQCWETEILPILTVLM